ncbi:helix-turn-helix transcriptional regulator [Streptomyces sp. NPDC046984]|uniref:helix-turn-helix transcriptional regulator n=1 Tax=Streptomyces sp. NPDC046984 TaxID=3155138 RepID=UPI0033E7B8B5
MSAYVVLGLLHRHPGATPYELDQRIRQSIGHFWVFPRSQLYAEAGRLVRRGLVVERQEEIGRRRRTLSLTDVGRHELQVWLAAPTRAITEIHDEALLRLYFQPLNPGESDARGEADAVSVITELATEQIQAHEEQLAEYQRLLTSGESRLGPPQRATLEVGLRFEKMIIGFWREIADSPKDLLG